MFKTEILVWDSRQGTRDNISLHWLDGGQSGVYSPLAEKDIQAHSS
jgi:hypothetical protein